ncbi:hypothetical protein B0A48_14423 [Cryoendolithus antarcticus]|uniref:F-box domain-containing protein n=1 Tax=Cryoendolithus antarcticus TaxID=1507870 RepID=A0A1V8SJW3_9PEZI|nr:hypothetical protein B0A48_14423 [Cryoendolithus antarcticus]
MEVSLIEDLPEEVLDNVIAGLTLPDICTLRICSRTMGAKTAQPRYKANFRRTKVGLERAQLALFVGITRNDGMGCIVEDLTLEGILEKSSVSWPYQHGVQSPLRLSTSKSKACIALLSEALRNIQIANGDVRRLRSLTLRVVDARERIHSWYDPTRFVVIRDRWRPIWNCASTSFNIAISALAESGTTVEQMCILDNNSEQRGSIASSTVHLVMQRKQIRAAMPLRALKRLSLSLSDPEIGSQLFGLRYVLEACPELEALAVHQFSIGAKFLPETQYTPAARCGIREFWKLPQTAEQNLTCRTTPQSLRLQHITLVTGSFEALFGHCTAETSSVTTIDFKDLCEGALRVTFDSTDSYDLRSEGGAIRNAISYHTASPARTRFEIEPKIQQLYGPF